jgi:hypothetical protein
MSSGTEYALRLVEVEKELAAAQAGWKLCASDLASETKRANAAELRAEKSAAVVKAAAGVSDAADAWEVCGEDGENRVTTYDVPAAAMRELHAALDALPSSPPPDAKTRTER